MLEKSYLMDPSVMVVQMVAYPETYIYYIFEIYLAEIQNWIVGLT